jgi:hypothetical protein
MPHRCRDTSSARRYRRDDLRARPGLTGACPGPLVALIGGGVPVMAVAPVGALACTWLYGFLRPYLPH